MPLPPRRTIGIMGTIVTSRTHTLYVFTWQRKREKVEIRVRCAGEIEAKIISLGSEKRGFLRLFRFIAKRNECEMERNKRSNEKCA
jgi:hypothetical protein